jgi:hypothetical protein
MPIADQATWLQSIGPAPACRRHGFSRVPPGSFSTASIAPAVARCRRTSDWLGSSVAADDDRTTSPMAALA